MKRRPKILQLFNVRMSEKMSRFHDFTIARAQRFPTEKRLAAVEPLGFNPPDERKQWSPAARRRSLPRHPRAVARGAAPRCLWRLEHA
jgi:hypothetical protein